MKDKTEESCANCISVGICPLRGQCCCGYNDTKVFRALLKALSPRTDWDDVFRDIEENSRPSGNIR